MVWAQGICLFCIEDLVRAFFRGLVHVHGYLQIQQVLNGHGHFRFRRREPVVSDSGNILGPQFLVNGQLHLSPVRGILLHWGSVPADGFLLFWSFTVVPGESGRNTFGLSRVPRFRLPGRVLEPR